MPISGFRAQRKSIGRDRSNTHLRNLRGTWTPCGGAMMKDSPLGTQMMNRRQEGGIGWVKYSSSNRSVAALITSSDVADQPRQAPH